jgi:hypothetical protein
MANHHKNKKAFGVSDIDRYYSGKMPPQEMHELEKAALEDSFLADAMEGFVHTKSASEDVVDLRARLYKRKHHGKTNDMFFRAAAMIIVIAGAGWLLYQLAIKDQDNSMSYRNKPEISIPQLSKDSSANNATLSEKKAGDQKPKIKEERSKKATTIIDRTQISESADQPTIENREVESSNVVPDSLEAADARGDVAMAAPRLFKSPIEKKVHNDSGLLRNSLPVQKRTEPYDEVQIISKGNQVMITIKETPDGINEMVLSRKKKDSLVKKGPSIIIEEAEPEESWSEFGEYLSENMRKLEDIQSESLTGTVKLSFDVNTSGEPVNIHVEKSLCNKCDAEALRLLKEGPKWKKKTKRGKVIIQF